MKLVIIILILLHTSTRTDMLAERSRPHDTLSKQDGITGDGSAFGDSADGELDSNLWGGVLVRLSSVVGDHLKRSGGPGMGRLVGGANARKSCALIALLGR